MKFFFIFSLPIIVHLSCSAFAEDKNEMTNLKNPSQNIQQEQFIPESGSSTEYFILCKNLKIVRSLRVEKTKDKCITLYTKLGVDKSIGSSIQVSKCQDYANQVRDTLVKAGWKCKEIKSGVTHLNE